MVLQVHVQEASDVSQTFCDFAAGRLEREAGTMRGKDVATLLSLTYSGVPLISAPLNASEPWAGTARRPSKRKRMRGPPVVVPYFVICEG